MKIITFNDEQLNFIRELAEQRCLAKDESIRWKNRINKGTPGDAHFTGLLGEFAYQSITDKKVDLRILAGGDDMDFQGVEVKCSTWLGKDIELKIKVQEYNRKFPKAYVLARVRDNNSVEFIGSITRERFDKIKYLKRHTLFDNWCALGEDLDKYIIEYDKDGKIIKHDLNPTQFSDPGASFFQPSTAT
jgi:hypothetical protein